MVICTKKVTEKIDKIFRPENCEFFVTQRINEDLYGKLKDEVTSQDKRLQKSKKNLTTAAISISNIINVLMNTNLKLTDKTNRDKIK